jgi:hypothetical protein
MLQPSKPLMSWPLTVNDGTRCAGVADTGRPSTSTSVHVPSMFCPCSGAAPPALTSSATAVLSHSNRFLMSPPSYRRTRGNVWLRSPRMLHRLRIRL